jgi:hypothetical protein
MVETWSRTMVPLVPKKFCGYQKETRKIPRHFAKNMAIIFNIFDSLF